MNVNNLKRSCSRHSPLFFISMITIVAVLLTSPLPVSAQRVLEEVVVTARKREESMQDVPISIQAVSGEFIREQGLMDIQALAMYTPNFNYATGTGASDILLLRGMGTIGSGVHFEPSVGQQLNGYFFTRSRLGRNALIDMASIEVLKGPQGALIGKNTAVGALNMNTNKPTEEFEARLSTLYNFENSEGTESEIMVSGSLHDRVRGRVAAQYRDVDGWVKNRFTREDIQEREDLTLRAMLEVDILDNLVGEFMFQYVDEDRQGKPREVFACQDNPAASLAAGLDCKVNGSNQNGNIRQGVNVGEPFSNENYLYGATFTWDFDTFEIKSVNSFLEYKITDLFDADQLRTERISIDNYEKYSQEVLELRLASKGARVLDYQFGFNYFNGEMDSKQNTNITPQNFNRHEVVSSETESQSLFGQLDWHVNDQWTITAGGRFVSEERDGQKRQITSRLFSGIFGDEVIERPELCAPIGSPGQFGSAGCTRGNSGTSFNGAWVTGEIDTTDLSWNASISYHYNQDHMFYAAAATGWKSGGFDLRGLGDPSQFIFPNETSYNYEFGGRHLLFNGSLRFNWTAFYMEVEDLQVSSNDPVNTQQIVGQADVETKGVEFDILWSPVNDLNLSLNGAWLDAEYDKFTGACFSNQTGAQGCIGANGLPVSNNPLAPSAGIGTQVQDGRPLPYAAKWTLVTGADYTWHLPANLSLKSSVKWVYETDRFQQVDLNPLGKNDDDHRLDATLALSGTLNSGNRNHPWSIALVGRNLTDNKVLQFVSGSTLAGTGDTLFGTIEELRVISLKGTISW